MTFSLFCDDSIIQKNIITKLEAKSLVFFRRYLSNLFDNNKEFIKSINESSLSKLIQKLIDTYYVHFLIIIVSDEYIQSLNKLYRNINTSTDVLTFQNITDENENFFEGDDAPFSEIYISLETAIQQAKDHNVKLEHELTLLAIHGILHAIGYDHEISDIELEKMKSHEINLLQSIGLNNIQPLTHSSV